MEIPNYDLSTLVGAREVLSIRGECKPADAIEIDEPFLVYLSICIPEDDSTVGRSTCDPLAVWGTDEATDFVVVATMSY